MIVYDIQNLVKQYPGHTELVNNSINLQIQQGEIFGILGDNGAGKSTLVRQMANLLHSTSGRILLLERPLSHHPLHVPLTVGYMPQESHALNNLTVGESLYYAAHLRGFSRRDAQEERDHLLAFWEMGNLRDKYSSRLSGGQRRLLRLAVAIAGTPPVLLLDEPTNDLDPARRKLVWDNLRHINQQRGTTIIFITHDAIEAEKVIQRVGILRNGVLVANGRPADLKQVVDQKLRLELFFPPENPPRLPAHLKYHVVQPGRWLVWLNVEEVTAVFNTLNFNQIEDFRLYTATLEDLFLHYAQPQHI